jgi:hypothetical protein
MTTFLASRKLSNYLGGVPEAATAKRHNILCKGVRSFILWLAEHTRKSAKCQHSFKVSIGIYIISDGAVLTEGFRVDYLLRDGRNRSVILTRDGFMSFSVCEVSRPEAIPCDSFLVIPNSSLQPSRPRTSGEPTCNPSFRILELVEAGHSD